MDFDPICTDINTTKIDQWICRYQLPITDYVKSSEAFGFSLNEMEVVYEA